MVCRYWGHPSSGFFFVSNLSPLWLLEKRQHLPSPANSLTWVGGVLFPGAGWTWPGLTLTFWEGSGHPGGCWADRCGLPLDGPSLLLAPAPTANRHEKVFGHWTLCAALIFPHDKKQHKTKTHWELLQKSMRYHSSGTRCVFPFKWRRVKRSWNHTLEKMGNVS